MIAATRSQKRVAGRQPEDLNKISSKFQKTLEKIAQKNKKNEEPAKKGDALEQSETMMPVSRELELPFVEVRPLPIVERSQTETTKVPTVPDSIEKLLEIPKMPVEPGFKNRAPLQMDERAKDLVQDALKNTICITTEDLLNVSEPMRQELRKLLMKKRLEKKSVTYAMEADSIDDTAFDKEEMINVEKLPDATYDILEADTKGMAKGSVVVNDPVVQYISTLAPGQKPKNVIVASESDALRSVYPKINGVDKVESLLDPGSQIVSMSRQTAAALQIVWDPDITVFMESANKTLAKTLGLARNVPFDFGPITVYLQVHVIENAAYRVLLGRPFDTITESEVRNSRDGSQSLKLTDLNTGQRCVMQTFERGKTPMQMLRPVVEDFQSNSMN
jgi:hypothetical protein